jgi:hypothetical protein
MPRGGVVASALVVLACDPGYRLEPVAWTAQPERKWARDFDGLSLRTRPLQGLVGEWWLHPAFEVIGNTERVTLTAASLRTPNGRYVGVIDSRTASAPPGGGRLYVRWDFGRDNPAPRVLGEHAEIILEMSVGSRLQTIRIEYERTPCCG